MIYPFEEVRVVNLETVSGCNLRCEWCSLTITRKKLRLMAPETIDRVLANFIGMDVLVCAYLGGEPLLHLDFPGVVRQIRALGFRRVRIHTNGTRMSPELARDLADAGLTEVVFSVDGRDAAEFEYLRAGARFPEVRAALETFLDETRDRVSVGVQCMVPSGSPKVLNADLGDLRDRLNFQIVEYPHNWVWPEIAGMGGVAAPDAPQTPCFFTRYYMAFDWRGNVLPCCRCLNSERVLGDGASAREVWAGALEDLRQAHLRGEAVEPCASCDWYAPNVARESARRARGLAVVA